MNWTESLPTNTNLAFQLAVSDSADGPWEFVGPDATTGTSFYSSRFGFARYNVNRFAAAGTGSVSLALASLSGRYCRYQVTLTSSDGVSTPSFTDVQIWYSTESTIPGKISRYVYDASGNITEVTSISNYGLSVVTDVRTPNDLNQITTQVVNGQTWNFTYDLNGNLTEKTSGTDSWVYTWNDENRLVQVTGPGGIDVVLSYDSAGRMLTRTNGSEVITFVWDGWSCVGETTAVAGEATSTTTYYIPDGQLYSFTRDGDTYQVHVDALASVRLITDSTGAIVSHYEYDAWGGQLSSSVDMTPFYPYRYVGSLGVRWDSTLGMYYCRQRWYDPTVQRWISRDPVRSINRYKYCNDAPNTFVDRTGLCPSVVIHYSQHDLNYLNNTLGLHLDMNDLAASLQNVIQEAVGLDKSVNITTQEGFTNTPGLDSNNVLQVNLNYAESQVWPAAGTGDTPVWPFGHSFPGRSNISVPVIWARAVKPMKSQCDKNGLNYKAALLQFVKNLSMHELIHNITGQSSDQVWPADAGTIMAPSMIGNMPFNLVSDLFLGGPSNPYLGRVRDWCG